ncbi:flagellar assembly protein FliW [Azonexus sp.]|jgi:flagellar assembly factor FliW|uniref:flagellar assembly protein FliW n=1 Tax=Azonexus sp. TaxID=1872668 RepID=UPI002826E9FA|nr:flagellar assembly protein FliW [Azonexus sp.]MDR1994530.1 flagellar assembly protein FliW [Azonexus sp.]
MKVDTYLFGSIEVDPERIITFPNGLVAFEKSRRYTLIQEDAQGSSFTLQSLDEPGLALQIVDPTTLGFHYELQLSDAESSLLQWPAADDVVVMQVLYKKEIDGKADIVPNLRAPLVINLRARIGLQKVMENFRPNVTLSNLVSAV